MRYFRVYPLGLQVMFFFMLASTLTVFGSWCIEMLAPKLTGASLQQIAAIDARSPYELMKDFLVMQGVMSIVTYALTSLLYAYFTHPEPFSYVGLRAPGKPAQLLLVVLVMVGAIPFLDWLPTIISLLPFSAKVRASQDASEQVTSVLLNMPSTTALIRNFVVIALIPALGEELFFRGIIMRFVAKGWKNTWLALVVSAMLFALAHLNTFGFLSILIAGGLLGGIYYLTGSLWCSILGHLSFNGTAIILSYLAVGNTSSKNQPASDSVSIWMVIIGSAVSIAAFYGLWKTRTPLPETWTEDFDPIKDAEIAE